MIVRQQFTCLSSVSVYTAYSHAQCQKRSYTHSHTHTTRLLHGISKFSRFISDHIVEIFDFEPISLPIV